MLELISLHRILQTKLPNLKNLPIFYTTTLIFGYLRPIFGTSIFYEKSIDLSSIAAIKSKFGINNLYMDV